jgi:flagellar basal body-associated protein FliL
MDDASAPPVKSKRLGTWIIIIALIGMLTPLLIIVAANLIPNHPPAV